MVTEKDAISAAADMICKAAVLAASWAGTRRRRALEKIGAVSHDILHVLFDNSNAEEVRTVPSELDWTGGEPINDAPKSGLPALNQGSGCSGLAPA